MSLVAVVSFLLFELVVLLAVLAVVVPMVGLVDASMVGLARPSVRQPSALASSLFHVQCSS